MKHGFEDKFMEVQSRLIALCLEAVTVDVDMVYAYAYIGEGSSMFNAFFDYQGRIVPANQAITDRDILLQVLKIGTADIEKLRTICKDYETKCPTEMKMSYDCRTKRYCADYQYNSDKNNIEIISPFNMFIDWRNEIASAKN